MFKDNQEDVIEGELVDPSDVPANLKKYSGADVGTPSDSSYPEAKRENYQRVSRFQFPKLTLPVAVIGGAVILAMGGIAGLLSQILGLGFAAFVIWTVFRFADRTVNRNLQYKERRWEHRKQSGELEDDIEDVIRRTIERKIREKIRDKFYR